MSGAAAALLPDCCQVIDSEGGFQEEGLSRFVQQQGVIDARTNYQVVAIMGPQSSGKSTLMNHVFGTGFQEMDAMTGRQQTTKGVWLAKAPKVDDVCTLILDLEGSDGRERGEDDTNFERQSALFALAVADVLLINVWCHDIGREQGSGKPLMKTIFQVACMSCDHRQQGRQHQQLARHATIAVQTCVAHRGLSPQVCAAASALTAAHLCLLLHLVQ